MKVKLSSILTLLLALIAHISFAQEQTITGMVTDGDGLPLPGVNVVIQGTSTGTQTDFDGNYSIQASEGDVLEFSFVGLETQTYTIAGATSVNITMQPDSSQLDEVVVTALGIQREEKTLAYAAQTVNSEELNITENTNIKSALAGKVAGVQINAQAGSKLGESGRIRIRGGISLTSDEDPLYIIDGVPTTDPNTIDMSNVQAINVLKGPNATALYGQRASNGVVQITTKKGSQSDKLGIQLTSSISFDQVGVSGIMNYQNEYGQGYNGEAEFSTFDFNGTGAGGYSYPDWMSVFDGQRYFSGNVYADESWGPRFDGQPYIPWYATYQNSPYFGQTDTWEAHPNNVEDFYDTGHTFKNIVSVSGGGDNYTARISFTNLQQTGIIPESSFDKNFVTANFDFNLTDNLSIGTNINYSVGKVQGDFDDGYGSQTSGSFNSWFGRNIDVNKMKELQGLTSTEGYLASWNNWGLDYWAAAEGNPSSNGNYKKAAFWYNPYDWVNLYKDERKTTTMLGDVHLSYSFLDDFEVTGLVSRNESKYRRSWEVPYLLEYSSAAQGSPELYNFYVNSFGEDINSDIEDNYQLHLRYEHDFDNFDISALVGGNIRKNSYYRFVNNMDSGNYQSGGLILPNVYTFSNSRENLTASVIDREKQVNSIYANASLGYMDMIYLDASIRRDWSSALPSNNNGYTYPSVGGSFIVSELFDQNDILTFAKLRGGWAQVGDDVDALALNPAYPLGNDLYNGQVLEYDRAQLINPNIEPAMNTSFEVGMDLRFLNNRLGFNATYYNETRENEIIPISISSGTGYTSYLTNAGESEREGLELAIDADVIKTDNFRWNILANWATNNSQIVSLPGDLTTLEPFSGTTGTPAFGGVNFIHRVGEDWGQLRGRGFVYDDAGNRVIGEDGMFEYQDDVSFGSVLPDFTGGLVNTLQYKNFSLVASLDFQKGGKFYSLSEMWGQYSGLTANTAGLNDRGELQRNAVADNGGVHVVGVDESGSPVDTYVEAYDYHSQFQAGNIAEPYVHDASYLKLRDVSLSYRIPGNVVSNVFDSATISVIGRNLWLIAVSSDNTHEWDPSELSQRYGENAQLPSTRSIGMNVQLTF
ncbi:SusC/RagA family TonB-linked outer membrane protein [Zunongwangia sp. SCSIO 43204]|uniref:SusC/RagA family TonB-linked outer membrane protein n=1 Tax=Zunongwangia sp. SCSIO 43204 TaxID=2779359 RepID=UPI001CA83EF3|nr:SusC/RagA family TonB-linked outer membrane protein [Zunongwangia sp. SCSIO 43204]UAB84655.1 SusC/RagA family TonB-linked outer membrane protein [Zunongwangia sp. SCSIO 43204]